MVKKLDLTPEERVARKREQDRVRFKKYYEKNKTNPEYLAKRESYKTSDKELRQQIPASKQPTPPPPPQQPPTEEPSPVVKKVSVCQIDKATGKIKSKYPVITAIEVRDFMRNNPQYVLKNGKIEQVDAKTLKTYTGGIVSLAKVINGTDSLVGAFANYKKTIELFKQNKTYIKNGEVVNYQPSRFQTWLEYMFSAIRALKRGGRLDNFPCVDEIIEKYDSFYKEFLLKKSIQKEKDSDNIEYAVPTWDYFEKKVIEIYGKNSIQHLITVLYRYNAVRNDFVKLILTTNKEQEGFYIPRAKNSNIQIIKNSHKSTGVGHSGIDFIYPKNASTVIRDYININKIKIGDSLLSNSINDIVVDMLDKLHIKYPPTAKAVSVMRNIDSGIGDWNDIDTEDFVAKANRSKHSVNTRLHTYRRKQIDFNELYPLKDK